MSVITLFERNSPYTIEDITKNSRLLPSELDDNFLSLKGDDIKNLYIDTEENKMIITLNSGKELSALLPRINEEEINESNGVVDFKAMNNDIVLTTEDKTFSIDINSFSIIKNIGDISTVITGNYNPENGILTLEKDGGEKIIIPGFINYLTDGILTDSYLEDKNLILKMKNGEELKVDFSPLFDSININTVNFGNKTVRLNSIKTTNTNGKLKINDHLIIEENMTIENKKMSVGLNQVSGNHSLSVGEQNVINGDNSLGVGFNNQTDCNNTIVQGENNKISENGRDSVVFGKDSENKAPYGIITGLHNMNEANAMASANFGGDNLIKSGFSASFGKNNITNAQGGFTIGNSNKNEGEYSFVGGKSNRVTTNSKYSFTMAHDSIADGENVVVFGCRNQAVGDSAFVTGHDNQAIGVCSVAQNDHNITKGLSSTVGGLGNEIDNGGVYSWVFGTRNYVNGKECFVYGDNNKIDGSCLENIYIIGKNIDAKVKDTLYINKLNINSIEKAVTLKKYLIQMDEEGFTYKTSLTDFLQYLDSDFAMITEGEYVNYGDTSKDNKIILKGDVDEYEVVIDKIENTHIIGGSYDAYTKEIILKDNSGGEIVVHMDQFAPPTIEIRVHTNETLLGDGTTTNPLKVNPLFQTGQPKPVIDIVDTLPTSGLSVGDRYIIKEDVINAGFLYKFNDIITFDVDGWHLPSKDEWDEMLNKIDTTKNHAEKTSGWKGEIAGNLLKSNNYNGLNTFGFSIVPSNYITDEGPVTNMHTKFWTSKKVLDQYDIYTKRFKIDTGKVYNEAVSGGDESEVSVRLVKDYDSNYPAPTQVILNGVTYPVLLMPDGKLWLGCNLADNTITHSVPDSTTPASIETTIVAEWDGTKWLKGELKDGFSVIVIDKGYDEYTMQNGVLVPYNFDPTIINERLDLLEDGLTQEILDRTTADTTLQTNIDGKVDKVVGKQLSTEDYTTEEKTKLSSLENYDDTEVKEDILVLETEIGLKANITDVYNKTESDGKYVQWVSPTDHQIILEQNKKLIGTYTKPDTTTDGVNLIMVNAWNEVDIASNKIHTNLNSIDRPTVQLPGQTGATAEKIAFLSDIPNILDLEDRVEVLEDSLAQEILDRTTADTTLQTNIDTVTTNLTQEISTRISEDDILEGLITTEATTRQNADTLLNTKIDTETAQRAAQDIVLQANLDTETIERKNDDIKNIGVDFVNGVITLTKGDNTTMTTTFTSDFGSF